MKMSGLQWIVNAIDKRLVASRLCDVIWRDQNRSRAGFIDDHPFLKKTRIPMRMNVNILLLAVSLISVTAHAGDSPLCKQICASDKKQCRDEATADEKTDKSASSLAQSDFVNPRKVPTSFVADKLADGDNQSTRNDEAGNRRFEKQQVCEKDFRHCADACSADK